MSRVELSVIYWIGFWGIVVFAIPEITAAVWPGSPIMTLSSTVKYLEGRWVWACFLILVGLLILNVHLVGRFLPALLREIIG